MNKRAKLFRFILGFLIGAFYIALGYLVLIIFENIFPNVYYSIVNWFFLLLLIIYLFVLIYLKKKRKKEEQYVYLRRGLSAFLIVFLVFYILFYILGAWRVYWFAFIYNCGNGYQHSASTISRIYNNEEEKNKILAAEKIKILPFDEKGGYSNLYDIEKRVKAENKATKNDFVMFIRFVYIDNFSTEHLLQTNYSSSIVLGSPPLVAIKNDVFGRPMNEYYDVQGNKISLQDCQALLGRDYYKIEQTYSSQSGCTSGDYGNQRSLYFSANDKYVCGNELFGGVWMY